MGTIELEAEIEALRREVERLRLLAGSEHSVLEAVLEHSPHGIIVSDVDGRLVLHNRASERIWAGSSTTGGIADWTKYRGFHPDGRPYEASDWLMARCLATGETIVNRETHFQRFDDSYGTLLGSAAPIRDAAGKITGAISVFADITESVRTRRRFDEVAAELEGRVHSAQLSAAISSALTGSAPLGDQLRACAGALVEHLAASFARIWTLSADGTTLELQASAGLYTHIDGPHGRVPVGRFKIGLIAEERKPHLSNDVQHDPRVGDREWAVREGLVGFAGYPLLVQNRLIGVMGMFSRGAFTEQTLAALAAVADVIALGIERGRSEALRTETEMRKTSILEAALDCIVVIDAEGRVIDFNPAAERQFGYRREDALGKEMASLIIPPSLRERHRVGLKRYLETGEGNVIGKRIEITAMRADGSELPVELTITPMSLGATRGFTGYLRDITARKVASERREFLTELGPALASVLDVRKTLAALARLAVPRLADWCAVDMIGLDGVALERVAVAHIDHAKVRLAEELVQRYPPDPNADIGVPKVVRTGKSEHYAEIPDAIIVASAVDAEHLQILRELRLRSAMIVPLKARGRILGALTFVHAESDRRYTSDDLAFVEEFARRAAIAVDNAALYESEQNARRNAELASRAKDDFLATVSHELRTPLNAMLGWTRMLRGGELPADKQARALETIERNAVTQAQLIEDLLDVSRIVSGKLRLDVQSVEMPAIVEHAVDALRLASEARNVRLLTTIDDNAGTIMGDPHRLQQVLWNLLSNAIKFTPKGGKVHLKLERVDSSLRIAVTDTGRGISPEFLPHVFERFRQADGATTRAYGGLGLGLAISRHIVELHGGSIDVTSKGEGQGATFVVLLPISPIRREGLATSSRLPHVVVDNAFEIRPELKGLKVLVIDDEPDARDLLVAVLEKCGSIVETASTTAEALEKLKSDRPDVLISDIGMPGEDGYALIRAIRALPPSAGGNIPAAALTAYARAEDRRKALDAGYMMHVPKPVEPAELVAVIANLARFAVRP